MKLGAGSAIVRIRIVTIAKKLWHRVVEPKYLEVEMSSVVREFLIAAKQAPSIYFAPLLGAIHGVKAQWDERQATGKSSK